MPLSREQVAEFRRSGYTICRGLLPGAAVAALSERLDTAALGGLDAGIGVQVEPARAAERSADPLDDVRKIWDVVPHDATFRAAATSDAVLRPVRALLGDDVRFAGDECQLKPRFHGSAHGWHQDAPYFSDEPLPLLTVWIAIDAATTSNGCMELLPGRHRSGVVVRKRPGTSRAAGTEQPAEGPGSFVGLLPEMHFTRAELAAEEEAAGGRVAAELRPGDALLFDVCTPHGSGANRTASRRRSVIFRYVAAPGLDAARRAAANRIGALRAGAGVHPVLREIPPPAPRL